MASKPNLFGASCVQLTLATTFALGRDRLAEDMALKPSQLLKHPNTLREQYLDETGRPWELTATFALLERVDDGQDQWSLELTAERPGVTARPPDGSRKPTRVLTLLGKMGMESNFDVSAGFVVPEGTALRAPKVPVEQKYVGGAFSHLIGYTLAKVQDLEILYEVTVRWLRNMIGVAVAFTYRRKLDDTIYTAALDRARELFVVTHALKTQEPPSPPQKTDAPAGDAPKAEAADRVEPDTQSEEERKAETSENG